MGRIVKKNQTFKMLAVLSSAWIALYLTGCKAKPPSRIEKKLAHESKELVVGGKDWNNPVPDTPSSAKLGAEDFQRHCQFCHGVDGHATGVPFAQNMSPPVPDLAAKDIQSYTDGQLKWIIENGIRLSGMPRWKGLLQDEEMWRMVRYMRHLPSTKSHSQN